MANRAAVFQFTNTIHNDTYSAIDPASKSDLNGKYVFISGASKGIGRATALAYAKAGAAGIGIGARSDLSSLKDEIQDAAKKVGKSAPKVVSVKLDVEDRASVETAAKDIETGLGRLDILVNNAGYLEKATSIIDSDPDEWWKVWGVNIRGPYLMTRSFLPLMLREGDKQIVNLSSLGAHAVRPGMSGYQTTKMAIVRFSEFTNAEYGDQGVVAFSVHPGGIMTDLARGMPEDMHHILTDTPELASDTIVYLTQKKQDWLAGRYISCNWDMPEFFAKKDDIVKRDILKFRMAL